MRYKTSYAAFFLFLTSCAFLSQPKTPQDWVNEANLMITATANVVRTQHTDGLITTEKKDRYKEILVHRARQVDDAQSLLDEIKTLGDDIQVRKNEILAINKAKLVTRILREIQRELAENANGR